MVSRLNLQAEFEEILGSRNVYFQPPSSLKMKYPCIRYSKAGKDVRYANNKAYVNVDRYEGVVIDYDPDSEIPNNLIEHFKMCSIGSGYTADNLNHIPFTLYYKKSKEDK